MKSHMKIAGIAVGSVLALAIPAIADAQDQTPPVVKEFVAAINGKDAKRLSELLAADFVMPQRDASCPQQQSDRDCQLAQLQRTLLGSNGKIELATVKSQREISRFNVTLTSDAIRAAGVSRIAATKEIVIANGKIRSLITTLRTDDPETKRYKQRAKV